jgi:hypothetical protein
MASLDDLRRQFPLFDFNVYAPSGGRVTLEIIDGSSEVTAFEGATLASCIARAFPEPSFVTEPVVEPEPVEEVMPGLFD